MANLANLKDLEVVVTSVLKPEGYRKKKTNWYLETDDCILMVNLQKSRWGGQFYINLAVLITDLNKNNTPQEYECHIRARLDEVVPNQNEVKKTLDLEDTTIPTETKIETLANALNAYGIPFLSSLNTLSKIKEKLQRQELKKIAIRLDMREYLGFPDE